MKKLTYILILIVSLTTACESLVLDEKLESRDPRANFEYLWNQVDQKYAYFDLKNIDWDERHLHYSSLIGPDMSDDSLFQVLGDMLRDLRDAHVNLTSHFNLSYFQIERLGQDNFNWRTITDHYLPQNYYVSGPFAHDFIADGQIGYVRFPSFSGGVDDNNLDFILNRYANTKGLILDIRENGGGTPADMYNLLRRFVKEKTLIYYSRIKNGADHESFTDTKPAYVSPHDGIVYHRPVVVLTDRGTYSAATFTSLAIKAIPQMMLVGDTTGGGLGIPNGGQLPNGWTYRFSISQTLTLDMDESYENGVPPDVLALFDWSDISKDEILDTAIAQILN